MLRKKINQIFDFLDEIDEAISNKFKRIKNVLVFGTKLKLIRNWDEKKKIYWEFNELIFL